MLSGQSPPWERDDDGPLEPETFEQRLQRHRAATFSLIGLEITERGSWDGNEVIVDLKAGFIANEVDASDDRRCRLATRTAVATKSAI